MKQLKERECLMTKPSDQNKRKRRGEWRGDWRVKPPLPPYNLASSHLDKHQHSRVYAKAHDKNIQVKKIYVSIFPILTYLRNFSEKIFAMYISIIKM